MPRCYFCNTTGFANLDEVTMHLNIVSSTGGNICKGLTAVLDPHRAMELFPMKVLGRKYPAKSHDGTFMMYTSEGKVSKTKLVQYLLSP